MAIRRAHVEKFAEEHGIELRINDPKDYLLEITEFRKSYSNHGRPGINHVHAYTKTGEVFGSSDLHNLSVWDEDCAVAINWADVLAELCDEESETDEEYGPETALDLSDAVFYGNIYGEE